MKRLVFTLFTLGLIGLLLQGVFAAGHERHERVGGDLVFVNAQIARSLDANVWTATAGARIMRQIYDPLVWQPEGGVFVPGLAERWEVSEDGLEYTFYLRNDVAFHDGTPFNAEAVKYTYDRMADPASKSLQLPRLGPYERSEVIDEFTVKVVMREPFPVFLSNASEVALAPASPTAIETMGDDYALNPVATGPFKVRRWIDNNTLVLERNEDYNWAPSFFENQGTSYLDTITYRFITEPATRVIAVETGEADIADGLPPQDIARLEGDGRFNVLKFVAPGLPQVLNINVTSFPMNDIAVRRAMLFGVDRQIMADLLFFGINPAANGPLSSASWAYWPGVEEMYPYDPEQAVQILEEAGWIDRDGDGVRENADGQPLMLRHVTSSGGANPKVAEFVQASLLDLGFDYNAEIMPYEATARRYADNDYELARLGYHLIDPHDTFFLPFHSSQIEEGGQFNRSRIDDPKIDGLIRAGLDTTDVEERRAIYRELQEYIMEQALVLPAYEWTITHAMQDEVMGFRGDLLSRPYMNDVWLQKR
jgi:peptide/nickel transport system substrate-binding protein